MDRLRFEEHHVQMPAEAELFQAVDDAGVIAITGEVGTGRSTLVRSVASQRASVVLGYGSRTSRAAHVLREAAVTLGRPDILRTYAKEGIKGALDALDAAVGDRLLVLDDADHLLRPFSTDGTWADPVPGMVAPVDDAIRDWILHRSGTSILVGRSSVLQNAQRIRHTPGTDWPITLQFAEHGVRNWPALARKLGARLDRFYFARAAAPLLAAETFNELVDTCEVDEILRVLASEFRSGSPRRAEALDLVSSLGGAPPAVVRRALGLALPRGQQDPMSWLESVDGLYDRLVSDHLLVTASEHGAVLPSAALYEAGAVDEIPLGRCKRLAIDLAESVNDPATLEPADAAVVLTAHDLAVHAGLEDVAIRTARLHMHGLVDLARRLGRDEGDRIGAFRLYDRIAGLLPRARTQRDGSLCRVRSYVLNYRAHNGRLADALTAEAALSDVTEATELWPDNARWHGHRIRLLLELARPRDAFEALEAAENGSVKPHPQRARHLRVHPAAACMERGEVQVALKLLRIEDPPWIHDDEARQQVKQVMRRLQTGLAVHGLDGLLHTLVFRGPQSLSLVGVQGPTPWTATLLGLASRASGSTALQALEKLADRVGQEVAELVRTPTPWLADVSIQRKGEILASVDVLQSQLGLSRAAHRWLVGRIENERFLLMDNRLGDTLGVERAALDAVAGDPTKGLWFGRVAADAAGLPTGAINQLEQAGAGRSVGAIRAALAALWDDQP